MPWIVDGNNVARGGERRKVREAALALARAERLKVVVVFDGAPPPGSPEVEHLGGVEVRYARIADRTILAMLGSGGRGWRVVTDDRELGRRAKELGAELVPTAAFLARVRGSLARAALDGPRVEIEQELAYFSDPAQRLRRPAGRVRKRRRT